MTLAIVIGIFVGIVCGITTAVVGDKYNIATWKQLAFICIAGPLITTIIVTTLGIM